VNTAEWACSGMHALSSNLISQIWHCWRIEVWYLTNTARIKSKWGNRNNLATVRDQNCVRCS